MTRLARGLATGGAIDFAGTEMLAEALEHRRPAAKARAEGAIAVSLDLRLNQRLDLSLKLAPQIIQSIELLQLPAMDLHGRHRGRARHERVPRDGAEDRDAPPSGSERPRTTDPPSPAGRLRLRRRGRAGTRRSARRAPRAADDDPGQNKIEAMNNTASDGPTLQESVIAQYRMLPDAERDAPLAEQIIVQPRRQRLPGLPARGRPRAARGPLHARGGRSRS